MKCTKVKLEVGARAFWNGKIWEIVAADKHHWMLFDPHEQPVFGLGTAHAVPKSQVEVVADEAFNIGDKVRTHHTFTGKVVAFDRERNEVICISTAPDPKGGERARWAYKVNELQHMPQFTFELNKVYRVSYFGRPFVEVRAVQEPRDGEQVVLYRADTGTYVGNAPRSADLDDLERAGVVVARY